MTINGYELIHVRPRIMLTQKFYDFQIDAFS